MTESLLENPIWSSLRTDHARLAEGDDCARRYPHEIGPLAGIPDASDESYTSLRPLAGDFPVVLFSLDPIRPPRDWTVIRSGTVVQMARTSTASTPHTPIAVPPDGGTMDPSSEPFAPDEPLSEPDDSDSDTESLPSSAESSIAVAPVLVRETGGITLRPLTPADAPAMVALAELTEPGPFRLRTIELGNFYGIFRGAQLVSMAGKRMHMPGYVEVSGVCTHPDARGHGYARALMRIVIDEIEQSGRTPFLHAWHDNPAIRLYESLGFSVTRAFDLAVLKHCA